jgi:hypothetical protein
MPLALSVLVRESRLIHTLDAQRIMGEITGEATESGMLVLISDGWHEADGV